MANIQKRGDTYRIRVSCGYDVEGKQITRSMTYKPEPGMTKKQIEKELERQAVLFEEKCQSGLYLGENIKFGDYALEWLQTNKGNYAPKTYLRYKVILDRVIPAIGHIKLKDLRPFHLQEFYRNLAEEGIKKNTGAAFSESLEKYLCRKKIKKSVLARNAGIGEATVISACKGKNISLRSANAICEALNVDIKKLFTVKEEKSGLSDQTIKHHHRCISCILAQATREQLIQRNISRSEYMKAPRVQKKDVHYLDDHQAREFVELLMRNDTDIKTKTSLMLLVYSGMRLGELCGLEWIDIDFKNELIRIERASQYIPGYGIITKEPKNESSCRTIKLPRFLFNQLKEYKKWYDSQRLKMGGIWTDSNRLFIQENGKPIYPATVGLWLKKFRERNNLPYFTPHSLRHTNITLQIAAGVPIRQIAQRSGHSQTSTTTNIYAHAIQTADEMASHAIDDLLTPKTASGN